MFAHVIRIALSFALLVVLEFETFVDGILVLGNTFALFHALQQRQCRFGTRFGLVGGGGRGKTRLGERKSIKQKQP
jgi:hypothetical protein